MVDSANGPIARTPGNKRMGEAGALLTFSLSSAVSPVEATSLLAQVYAESSSFYEDTPLPLSLQPRHNDIYISRLSPYYPIDF